MRRLSHVKTSEQQLGSHVICNDGRDKTVAVVAHGFSDCVPHTLLPLPNCVVSIARWGHFLLWSLDCGVTWSAGRPIKQFNSTQHRRSAEIAVFPPKMNGTSQSAQARSAAQDFLTLTSPRNDWPKLTTTRTRTLRARAALVAAVSISSHRPFGQQTKSKTATWRPPTLPFNFQVKMFKCNFRRTLQRPSALRDRSPAASICVRSVTYALQTSLHARVYPFGCSSAASRQPTLDTNSVECRELEILRRPAKKTSLLVNRNRSFSRAASRREIVPFAIATCFEQRKHFGNQQAAVFILIIF